MLRILKRLLRARPEPDDRKATHDVTTPTLEEPSEIDVAELECERRAQEFTKIEREKMNYEEEVKKRMAVVLGSHTGLTRIYRRVESIIGRANYEFEARAFAPFWDLIEQAVELLAKSKSQSETVLRDFQKFVIVAKSPPVATTVLDLPDQEILIPDFKELAAALRATVRRAQTDFEFSTIYEQRRSNRILIEGFSTLGNAIDSMEGRLAGEIGRLNRDIQSGLDALQAAQRVAANLISDSIGDLADSNARAAEEASAHDVRVEEMLDNIQRRRKPL